MTDSGGRLRLITSSCIGASVAVLLLLALAPPAAAQVQVAAPDTTEADSLSRRYIAWLRQHAFPIRTEDPTDEDFSDLQRLKPMLAGVRIIGLGEQTHGTREFFRMKHRLLSFLVREMGVRTFALEASQTHCEAINDYVEGKSADGAAALAGQGFWMWDTEEVRALVDWMRAYNASVGPADRVRFVGIDYQYRRQSEAALLDYLRRVAPARVGAVDSLFQRTPEWFPIFLSNDSATKAQAWQRISAASAGHLELLGFLVLNERELVRLSSVTEYQEQLHHARLLTQYTHWPSETGPSRDYAMAENLARIVDADSSGARVVLWAHNYHVAVNAGEGTTGYYLRRMYGTGYMALGFAFDHGSFQSYDLDAKPRPTLAQFTIPPASDGTVDWHLARVGFERYIVDLRDVAPEPVATWLATPQPMRSFGTIYSANWPASEQVYRRLLQPGYDGLLFIRQTTRARPNRPSPTSPPLPAR